MPNDPAVKNPWYREPWPWILMAGPAIVIIAGVITSTIAWRTSDGLVVDDYYKQGLAINQTLQRDERARALGLAATITFNPGHDRLRLVLSGAAPQSGTLQLALLHPTQAGYDQSVRLARLAEGLYEAELTPPRAGLWHVHIEDSQDGWRLTGDWRTRETSVMLGQGMLAREEK